MTLVAPLVSNIWKGFTCLSPLCICLWPSLMQPKAWTSGAQHCCEGEVSSGAVRRWMFDTGQKCFLHCVFAKSVTGKPILRKTLHSCYEWTLLLPKYDCLSGANQWQQDDLWEWIEQKTICLIELVQLFCLMKQHDYNLPTKAHKQLE